MEGQRQFFGQWMWCGFKSEQQVSHLLAILPIKTKRAKEFHGPGRDIEGQRQFFVVIKNAGYIFMRLTLPEDALLDVKLAYVMLRIPLL